MSQTRPTAMECTKYAEHYVLHGDQTKSWRKAFPKNKAKAETQHQKASGFHKLAKVRTRIAELRIKLVKLSEDEFDLSAAQIKTLLATAAYKGLRDKTDEKGEVIQAESISGAVSALSEINKMDGNHAATKLALGGDPNAPPVETKVTVTHRVIHPNKK